LTRENFAFSLLLAAQALHANALGILTNAWPTIIPPGPGGIVCLLVDATTEE